jgi:hypothetical protein
VAAQNGHASVTKQLIEARCNIDVQEEEGYTPLVAAAAFGHASVTKQLIEARCNIDVQGDNGCTPIYIAAQNGHAPVTKQLIEARCDIDLQTKGGETALQAAQRAGHAAIVTLIRNTKQKGAKNVLLQASPENIQKQQEAADRAMKELLEAEETERAAAAAGSQKKKQAKAGKSEKKEKTENVAVAAVAAALKAKVEVAAAVGNDASAAGEEQDSRLQEGAIVKIHSLQSAAAQQHNGAHAELGKFNPDTGRWQAKLLRGKTLSGIEIAVKPANLLFAEGGGKEEEERRQEALEEGGRDCVSSDTAPQAISRKR